MRINLLIVILFFLNCVCHVCYSLTGPHGDLVVISAAGLLFNCIISKCLSIKPGVCGQWERGSWCKFTLKPTQCQNTVNKTNSGLCRLAKSVVKAVHLSVRARARALWKLHNQTLKTQVGCCSLWERKWAQEPAFKTQGPRWFYWRYNCRQPTAGSDSPGHYFTLT